MRRTPWTSALLGACRAERLLFACRSTELWPRKWSSYNVIVDRGSFKTKYARVQDVILLLKFFHILIEVVSFFSLIKKFISLIHLTTVYATVHRVSLSEATPRSANGRPALPPHVKCPPRRERAINFVTDAVVAVVTRWSINLKNTASISAVITAGDLPRPICRIAFIYGNL